MSIKNRVTIKDIASNLNISLSTVNKALTGKNGISDKKRKEVIEMAYNMGYKVNKVAQSLARKIIRIGVIIPNDWPQFYGPMEKGIKQELDALIDHNVHGIYKYFSHHKNNKDEIDNCVDEIVAESVDGVILCPAYYYNFMKTLERFQENHISVILAGNDLPLYGDRLSSIRVNTNIAGRLAAEIIKLYLSEDKSIAVFIGNKSIQVHKEKVEGFIEEINSDKNRDVGVYETQDDPELAYYLIKKLHIDLPDIGAIYVATGNSLSICKFIIENHLENKIKIVATDVFEEIVEYMEKGVVCAIIFQNAEDQGKLAVKAIYKFLSEGIFPEKNILVTPHVILKNNIRLYLNQ